MEIDSRAVLAFVLVIVTTMAIFYAMYLGWDQERILGIGGFFVPFVSAAVAFYFGQKNEAEVIRNDRKRLELEERKLEMSRR